MIALLMTFVSHFVYIYSCEKKKLTKHNYYGKKFKLLNQVQKTKTPDGH
jgi:hypothetical protein